MDDSDGMRLLNHFDPSGVAGLSLFVPKRIRDLITMVVTTSVIPFHPETKMLEEVVASHEKHESELGECKKIIVCDFPKLSVSGSRQFKSGKVLEEDMVRYEEYIQRLEELARKGEPPFKNTSILRCKRYRGFAMAVNEALSLVTTPYVMIIQHDRMLTRPFGLKMVMDVMQAHSSQIKYVGLASSKSDKQAHLMNSRYRIDVTPKMYILDEDPSESDEQLKRRLLSNNPADVKVPRRILVPLIFWYDSTHIACVDHYRDFVFGEHCIENVGPYWSQFKLGTGDFIEDKLGQAEREDVKMNGLRAHDKYGNYLLEDSCGPFVQHCHGRLLGTSTARTFETYFGDK